LHGNQTRHNLDIDNITITADLNKGADGRSKLTCLQTAETFGKTGRNHGYFPIRRIDGTSSIDSLLVNQAVFFYKMRHIRNMDTQSIMVIRFLDTQGIVIIQGCLSVYGYQGKIR